MAFQNSTFKIFFSVSKYNKTLISHCNKIILSRNSSSVSSEYQDRDPAPYFFRSDVQRLLKDLTRVNLGRVFRKKAQGGDALDPPRYQFMTSEQLEEAMKDAASRAEKALQMPPVVKVYVENEKILSNDPALKGYDTANYVFTDITYGLPDSERIILVREPNGELKHASHPVRQRINQTYFPVVGRKISAPKMFQDQYLKPLLERHEYEYILDRACVQFDPDDLMYHKITSVVYSHINENKKYDMLRSTRHFGPLAFYLCWIKSIDGLLIELIRTDFFIEAVKVISVLYAVHPDCKSNTASRNFINEMLGGNLEDSSTYDKCIQFVEDYIKNDSLKRSQLELALQGHREVYRQKKSVDDGIRAAHGRES